MGLISRVSSRTYRIIKKKRKMASSSRAMLAELQRETQGLRDHKLNSNSAPPPMTSVYHNPLYDAGRVPDKKHRNMVGPISCVISSSSNQNSPLPMLIPVIPRFQD